MSPRSLPAHPLTTAIRHTLSMAMMGLSTVALAQTDAAEPQVLGELVVSDTALKVEAPLVETPRPAAVVDREELDERNVQDLDETFRYRAGVRTGQFGDDNDTDWFKIRGFDQSTYQDGLRVYREGFYQWLPEPFGLERVELLKGPASVLYGETPPGGVINAISKRPTASPQGLLDLQAGTNDHRQLGVDTSGPVQGRDDVRYRLVGLYRDGEGDLDFTENERYYIAPSLEWDISDRTRLTLLASHQRDDAFPSNPFKLPFGTIQDTQFGKVDPSTNYSEPDWDTNERTQSAIGYALSHQVSDTWRFEQDLRYSELDLLLRSSFVLGRSATEPREGTRGAIFRDGEINAWTLDNRLVGKWFTRRTENTLLLGVDYQNLENRGEEAFVFSFDDIDLFDPQYGNFTRPTPADLTLRDIDKEQTGFYIQNQLRLDDRWVFLAGARHDQARTDNTNVDAGSTERADDNQLSLSGGIMYLGANGISPYLSYTESFQPTLGTDINGNLLDPRIGEQVELGVKITPADVDGYVNAAVYRLEEENALATSQSGIQVQEGERISEGFELESVAYLTDQLQVAGAYTYSDTDSRNKSTGEQSRAPLIPRHMASLWLDYSFADLAPGLKVGGGARFVGETRDGDTEVPSYTVFDLMAQYDVTASWRAQVNISNVADREYVASCDYWCYYGEARSVTGRISYRW